MDENLIIEKVKTFQAATQLRHRKNLPTNYWLTISNAFGDSSTTIVMPEAGTLWVCYEFVNTPAQLVEIWHQGGTVTPIRRGENFVTVGQWDLLVYHLGNSNTDSIKIGYQYV